MRLQEVTETIKAGHSRCQGCGVIHRNRSLVFYKGKSLCRNCRIQHPHYRINLYQYDKEKIGRGIIPLPKALSKVYQVHTYVHEKGFISCNISVPSCLAGQKVKLLLVL